VSFGISIRGRLPETAKNAGICRADAANGDSGTQRATRRISRAVTENNGARTGGQRADFFGYVLDGLSRMDQALEILVDVLQQPVFNQSDLDREKELQHARIKQIKENNSYRCSCS
jgi:predicted Zn-dependent peptidase